MSARPHKLKPAPLGRGNAGNNVNIKVINMHAPRDDCKPDVLIEAQDEITVEIDRGAVILRQQDALGNDPDQIIIALNNLPAFMVGLLVAALPPGGRTDDDERTDPSEIFPRVDPPRPSDPTAADRMRRYRLRKRNQINDVAGDHSEAAE